MPSAFRRGAGAFLLCCALTTHAAPLRSTDRDAPFSVAASTVSAAITCKPDPRARYGTVLLVHGTGSTGAETWAPGPYWQLLPAQGLQVCYVTLPNRALSDAQVSAEYVAHAVQLLAPASSTRNVAIIAHSQGNLNTQWALNFWPSIRKLVRTYVSIAGDFKGTLEGPFACLGLNLLEGGCEPSIIQQSVGSNYLAASNARGNTAFVPTTSVFTIEDDIIQPEIGPVPTSLLPNAQVASIQQLCSLAHVADHFTMTIDAGVFNVALSALTSPIGRADFSVAKPLTTCLLYPGVISSATFSAVPGAIKQLALDAAAVLTNGDRARVEAPLKPYVCQRGDAPSAVCRSAAPAPAAARPSNAHPHVL